jgi:gliding motility-associated-like protein
LSSQNEYRHWYFGNHAALDFISSTPVPLWNSVMDAYEGCATISDASANLLFYTDGTTIYNASHTVMANGSGILGAFTPAQGAIIIKQPGSVNLYYLFTVGNGNPNDLRYTLVDMSLASGQGSVVAKNISVCSCKLHEKITATKHCNGVDYWIVVRDRGYGNPLDSYKSFLLTSAGVSTTPIVSPASPTISMDISCMKISPNGRKLANAVGNPASYNDYRNFEVWDFDNSTGLVTNSITLNTNYDTNNRGGYGVEFSPDGSKLYGTTFPSLNTIATTFSQWNLCAGSASAISASEYVIAAAVIPTLTTYHTLQLAINGKIYAAGYSSASAISVINSPNVSGSGCNFVNAGQSISPNFSRAGLPNFVCGFFNKPQFSPPLFTFTASPQFSCQTAGFTSPINIGSSFTTACNGTSFSVAALQWNFGDIWAGSNNTASTSNPIHTYPAPGTYSVELVIFYGCGGGTDTLRQTVNITSPCVSLTTSAITCSALGSATANTLGSAGPFTFTWLPASQTGSAVSGMSPGNHTVVVSTSVGVTFTMSAYFAPLVPLSGTLSTISALSCNGATGSGSINLSGGSGSQTYLWTNGTNSLAVANPTTLGAGNWSVTVTDAITACKVFSVFTISQPPAMTLNISAGSSSVCLGGSVAITATNSGGTPGYSFQWTNGPPSSTNSVSESQPGIYIYTLTSTDNNSCAVSNTVAVDFVPNPLLTVTHSSICPLQTGTVSVSGASSYTWSNSSNSSSLSDNPLSTTVYTVIGEALSCTSIATASIILKPVPLPLIGSNAPVCNNSQLLLFSGGGTGYSWSGPSSFSSFSQNPVISPAALTHAGVYNVTVTAVNGCTASAQGTVVINPTPTLSAGGSTVCTNGTLTLSGGSLPGSSFAWSGPNNFVSSLQNPVITNPSLFSGGTYTLKVTSSIGCTNIAVANASVVSPPVLSAPLSSNSLCAQAFNGSPNSITLTANGANTYTLYTPNTISSTSPGGNPPYSLSTLPPYQPGVTVATATLFGSNGVCTSSFTASFSIIPNPTIGVTSNTPQICAGQTFTYTNSGASSYTWTNSTPNTTLYSNGGTAVSNPSIHSVFSVYGASLGCNSALVTNSISVNPLPTVSVTPQSSSVCKGSSVKLTAGGTADSFTWSPFSGLDHATGSQVNARPLNTITYTLTGSALGCTSSAVANVSVLALPTPTATFLKPRVCVNETVTMMAEGGMLYDWLSPTGGFYQGNNITLSIAASDAGTYTLTATDKNGCKGSTTTELLIDPLPSGSLGGTNMQGCVPFCSDFNFIAQKSVASKWQIASESYSGRTFSHCFTSPGIYTLTAFLQDSSTSCRSELSFYVEAFEKPFADFSWQPEEPVEGMDDVLLLNSSQGKDLIKWSWFFANDKNFKPTSENTSYSFKDAGKYPIAMIVKNTWGCEDSVVKVIEVLPDFNIYVPNAFTPNGDIRNETFLPITRGVKNYSFSIFNRWGELLFHTTDIHQGWDGTYKGVRCKEDAYNYVIKVTGLQSQSKEMKGSVMLLR